MAGAREAALSNAKDGLVIELRANLSEKVAVLYAEHDPEAAQVAKALERLLKDADWSSEGVEADLRSYPILSAETPDPVQGVLVEAGQETGGVAALVAGLEAAGLEVRFESNAETSPVRVTAGVTAWPDGTMTR